MLAEKTVVLSELVEEEPLTEEPVWVEELAFVV